jgi:hypothetical protein
VVLMNKRYDCRIVDAVSGRYAEMKRSRKLFRTVSR